MPMIQPKMQNMIDPTMFPWPASCCCAMLTACRTRLIKATTKDPKLMLPKLYVMLLRNAPLVAPLGIPPGFPAQKYQLPYSPAMVLCNVFLIHSLIQYPANVMKTSKPMTFALEQPPAPAPLEHAGLLTPDPLLLGSYLTYTATSVTEYHAPKAKAAKPPMALAIKTCPCLRATSIVVCSITTLNGMRGIQLTKQITLKMANSKKTTAAL